MKAIRKNLDEKAFDNGRAAFKRGSPKWANPYRGEGLRTMWEFGWLDARMDAPKKSNHCECGDELCENELGTPFCWRCDREP